MHARGWKEKCPGKLQQEEVAGDSKRWNLEGSLDLVFVTVCVRVCHSLCANAFILLMLSVRAFEGSFVFVYVTVCVQACLPDC